MIDAALFRLLEWSQTDVGNRLGKLRAMALVAVSLYLRLRYFVVRLRLKIVKRRRKLRVAFVIGDNCKWKCQTVYDAMMQSDDFDPYVAPTMMDLGWIDDTLQMSRVRECREFFSQRGMRILDVVSTDDMKACSFKEFGIDIVIYQQPWGMPRVQSPIAVSSYALAFYVPYFISTIGNPWSEFRSPFVKLLYGYTIENEAWKTYYLSTSTRFRIGSRIFACGCPIREEIAAFAGCPKESAVIYAPHWSIPHDLNPGSSRDSTFLWSGMPMLDYARKHAEIHWIFKPHPMLKIKLIQCKVMTEDAVEAYWNSWREIGEVCESGDYIPLFYRSMAMVTDCMSFQNEYLIVNRPLIHLRSRLASVPLPPGRLLETAFYDAWDVDEMMSALKLIVEDKQDPMAAKRSDVRRELGYDDTKVSEKLLSILRDEV